jgi:hypothetical protein
MMHEVALKSCYRILSEFRCLNLYCLSVCHCFFLDKTAEIVLLAALSFPRLGLQNDLWVELAPFNNDSFCYFQLHEFCFVTHFHCPFIVVASWWIFNYH